MDSEHTQDFRPLDERERKLLERLLDHHEFEGRDQLRRQLDSATARLIGEYNDNYGSIQLRVASPIRATVRYRVPVEAEYPDIDGIPVWVLLHVDADGFLSELEICRADGRPLQSPPTPERIEPFSANYDSLAEGRAGASKVANRRREVR